MSYEEEVVRNEKLLRLNYDLCQRVQRLSQSLLSVAEWVGCTALDYGPDLDLDEIAHLQLEVKRRVSNSRGLGTDAYEEAKRWQELYRKQLEAAKRLHDELRVCQKQGQEQRARYLRVQNQLQNLRKSFISLFQRHHYQSKANRVQDLRYLTQLLGEEAQNRREREPSAQKRAKASPSKPRRESRAGQAMEKVVAREKELKEDYFKQIEVMVEMKEQLWREVQEERRRADQFQSQYRSQSEINGVVRRARLEQLQYLLSKE